MARTSYHRPCRWYEGGPVGRIRYYRVPATNQLYTGNTVFAPSLALQSDEPAADTGFAGEIMGSAYTYERGTNFRPDLVGDHPAGTPEDFAGLTPNPVTPPPPVDCRERPGPELPLLFYGGYHRGVEPLFTPSLALRVEVDDPLACCALWWRSGGRADYGSGLRVDRWYDYTGAHRDAICSAFFGSDATAGTTYSLLGAPGGLAVPVDGILHLGGEHVIFWVAQHSGSGLPNHPWLVAGGLGGNAGVKINDADWRYGDTALFTVAPSAIPAGALHLYAVRRERARVRMYVDGGLSRDVAWNPAGHFDFAGITSVLTPHTPPPFVFWQRVETAELLCFNCALSDTNFGYWLSYLMNKFALEGPDVITGEIRMWTGTTAPSGWLLCDGAAYSYTDYPDLGDVLAGHWDTTAGRGQFNVPDFRGRSPVGPGASSGTTSHTLGHAEGLNSLVLAPNNLPVHAHDLSTNHLSAAAGADVPINAPVGPGEGSSSLSTENFGSGVPIAISPPTACVNFIVKT